jgi:hypothetical protein
MKQGKNTLADALQSAVRGTGEEAPYQTNTNTAKGTREGKKAVIGFFAPEVSAQLKHLAIDKQATLQLLLAEAINDFFIKNKLPPIAS